VIREEPDLPRAEGGKVSWGKGTERRNDPKNVCTCEYLNNFKKRKCGIYTQWSFVKP
jgi:hypothetical protein